MVASLSELEALDGVIPARQLRSREAQQRLLQAGEAVFARMGYDGAHVSDIAAAANVSIGSFYRRFRDKEALFHALQVEFVNRALFNIDRFFDMPKWREAAPGDLVYTLVRNTARAIERRAGFFRALFQRSLAGVPISEVDTLRQTDEHAGRRLAESSGRSAPPIGGISRRPASSPSRRLRASSFSVSFSVNASVRNSVRRRRSIL